MSTEPKHTPGLLGRNIPPVEKYPILFAGRNTHIARVITQGLSLEEAEANADFLVLAWNSHDKLKQERDELLSALKDLVEYCSRDCEARSPGISAPIRQARQTIANATT